MVRKRDTAPVAPPDLDDGQVAAFLRANPDFLIRHSELCLALSPPSRWPEQDGVVDMQVYLNERLHDELERTRGAAEHLIHTSRFNMSTQSRTHQAVLEVLAAESMAELAATVTGDLPELLDVDVATLCFETGPRPRPELSLPGVFLLPDGEVEKLLGGPDRDCALLEEMPGDPRLFGDAAGLVASSALVRLTAGGRCPAGVMALGSRHINTFHSGQGTELLNFLARVVENCIHRWVE
jgi:hypothetical protein